MLDISGLRIDRFPEINNIIRNAIQQDFGANLDLSENSLIGVLTDVTSLTSSYVEELSSAVYNSSNITAAEGYLLDNLALIVGTVRLKATKTRGEVRFSGDDGALVKAGEKVQSIIGDVFSVIDEVEISSTKCVELKVRIDTLVEGGNYTLQAGEVGATNTYRRPSTPNQTKLEILTDFQTMLAADEELIPILVPEDEPYLFVEKRNKTQNMSITGTSYFHFYDVSSPAIVEAEQYGDIAAEAGTITTYLGNISTPRTVINPYSLVRGRNAETDEEFRIRVLNSYRMVAGGTPDSTLIAVRNVAGVESVKVVENRTTSENARGMPPKSYQVIVYGGNSQLIAETLWRNKPAGIHCYSDPFNPLTSVENIVDANGQTHKVSFLRPSTKFVYVHVDYNLYSEENFPSTGDLIIREELANYGQTLTIGQDVISDRFYPHIYRNVSGVEDANVYIAMTDSLNSPPVFPDDYVLTKLPISDEQITNFSTQRVTTEKFEGDLPIR